MHKRFVISCGLALSACDLNNEALGNLGAIEFTSPQCFLPDCAIGPVMTTTSFEIGVSGGDDVALQGMVIASSDGAVLSIDWVVHPLADALCESIASSFGGTCARTARITTVGAGSAQITVDDGDHLIDVLDVEVVDPARVELLRYANRDPSQVSEGVSASDPDYDRQTCPTEGTKQSPGSEIVFSASADIGLRAPFVHAIAFGPDDRRLEADRGFTFESRDPDTAAIKPPSECASDLPKGDHVGLIGLAIGSTALELRVGELVVELPVIVEP